MRRVLGMAVVLIAVGAIALLGSGASGESDPGGGGNVFKVELDNAFGLTEGGDFKIAGVRAGKIKTLELDTKTKRAIVEFEITQNGFGSLRTDVTCAVAPQSLIGEYYIDCQPGEKPQKLKPGSTIPVERTEGTIPPDLVNNMMARPYRERLSFILAELGAGVAGNADNLNAALRRANPALRETNKVLALLANQNQTLADLTRDADRVVGDLADNRRDVARWVTEARDTARASAERDDELAAGFERLPTFLRELRPTMAELGATAEAQGPALRNLSASAGQLERLLRNIPPFADASRPAIDALGEASKVGRTAVKPASATVAELDKYSRGVPELGKNLAIILEHLDDRNNSAELDPRSPGGKGYTGIEALLQYVFDQTMSTNVHDGTVHILKAQPFEGECAAYADIEAAREHGSRCSTALGPNVIGLTFPDATAPPGYDGKDRGGPGTGDDSAAIPIPGRRTGPRDEPRNDRPQPGESRSSTPQTPAPAGSDSSGPVPGLDKLLPPIPAPEVPKAPQAPTGDTKEAQESLLDFLLGS